MEGDSCLQDVLNFIANGLQNPTNCDPQLLLLLVMLEEIYEAGDSIPLLTDRKESVERLIRYFECNGEVTRSESVSGIIKSVSIVLENNSVSPLCPLRRRIRARSSCRCRSAASSRV